jgi:hypothetical protein
VAGRAVTGRVDYFFWLGVDFFVAEVLISLATRRVDFLWLGGLIIFVAGDSMASRVDPFCSWVGGFFSWLEGWFLLWLRGLSFCG